LSEKKSINCFLPVGGGEGGPALRPAAAIGGGPGRGNERSDDGRGTRNRRSEERTLSEREQVGSRRRL